MAIPRLGLEAKYDFYLESVNEKLAELTSDVLSTVAADGFALACLGAHLQSPRKQIALGVRAAADAIVCRFAVMTGVERGLKVCDKPVALEAELGSSAVDIQTWLMGFWLNLLRRDQRAISFLSLVSIDAMRDSTVISSEYSYRMVKMLQAVVAEDPETRKLLMSAMEATDPVDFKLVDPEYALSITVHELNVLGSALSGDSEAFIAALEDGLEAFEEYWAQDDDRNESPWAIWLSACLARLHLPTIAACGSTSTRLFSRCGWSPARA